MPPRLNSPTRRWARYASAVIVVALALALRLGLSGFLGPGLTYITFYPAVMLAAILGRLGPGLLATSLSALLAACWLIPPLGRLSIQNTADGLGLAVFAVMVCSLFRPRGTCWLGSLLRSGCGAFPR